MIKLHINSNNEEITFEADKNNLMNISTYFKSMFTQNYKDSKDNIVNIDCSNIRCDVKYIKKLLKINLDKIKPKECDDDLQISINAKLKEIELNYKYEIQYKLTKKIPIYDYYQLFPVCDFFGLDNIKSLLESNLDTYIDVLNDNLSKCRNIYNIKKNKVRTCLTLKLNNTSLMNERNINNIQETLLNTNLANDFLNNAWSVYLTYKFGNRISELNRFLLGFNPEIISLHDVLTRLEFTLNEPEISSSIIKDVPLNLLYEFKKMFNNVIKFDFTILNIFDYQDILHYEEHDFQTYHIVNNNMNNNMNNNDKSNIITKEEFIDKFKKETNNVFDKINWQNMIISGGFIFGLLRSNSKSILGSTDIDIFLYGSKEEQMKKVTYLVDYFKEYNPYYTRNRSVINIIIKDMKYDVQIICTEFTEPIDIISNFDQSYVKLYYDGSNIYCLLDTLISIKYNVGIVKDINEKDEKDKKNKKEENKKENEEENEEDENKEYNYSRIYKTILKHVDVVRNTDLKCDWIDDENIFINKYENENRQEIYNMLNKSRIIRKLMSHCDFLELYPIIKMYYKARICTNSTNMQELFVDSDNKIGFKWYKNEPRIHNNVLDNCKIEMIDDTNNIIRFKTVLDSDVESKYINLEINEYYRGFVFFGKNEHYELPPKLKIILNETITSKLDLLKSKLSDEINKTIKKNKKISINYHFYNNIYYDDDYDETKPKGTFLYAHIPDKLVDKVKNIVETAHKNYNKKLKIEVLLSGRMYMTRPREASRAGIKFTVKDIKYDGKLNMAEPVLLM